MKHTSGVCTLTSIQMSLSLSTRTTIASTSFGRLICTNVGCTGDEVSVRDVFNLKYCK
jgi:hypothetical protein